MPSRASAPKRPRAWRRRMPPRAATRPLDCQVRGSLFYIYNDKSISIYIYVYTYATINKCVYIYMCICMYVYLFIHLICLHNLCIYIYIYVCVCTCVCVCGYVFLRIYMFRDDPRGGGLGTSRFGRAPRIRLFFFGGGGGGGGGGGRLRTFGFRIWGLGFGFWV